MSDTPDEKPENPPEVPHLTAEVVRICEAVGQFIEYWGFKAIHGRVWTLLALSRAPMNQADVARVLGVSRSLVNLAVSELTTFGLVRPVGDHRNAPYEAVLDVWPVIAGVLRSREWLLLENIRAALAAAHADLGRHPAGPWDAERVKSLLEMTELAQMLLKLLLSIRPPRGVASLTTWMRRAAALVGRFGR